MLSFSLPYLLWCATCIHVYIFFTHPAELCTCSCSNNYFITGYVLYMWLLCVIHVHKYIHVCIADVMAGENVARQVIMHLSHIIASLPYIKECTHAHINVCTCISVHVHVHVGVQCIYLYTSTVQL